MYKVVDRSYSIKDVDKNVRNIFSWKWLEEKDCNGESLSDYVQKIDQLGYALCGATIS